MSHKTSVSAPPSTPSPKERGKRAFQAGRFEEALRYWHEIAEPNDVIKSAMAEAHFRKAVELQLAEAAVSHMQAAVQLMPHDPVYSYWHAVALHKNDRFDMALAEYQRAESLGLAQAPGAFQRDPSLTMWLARHATGSTAPLPDPASTSTPINANNTTPRMVYDALALLARNNDEDAHKALSMFSQMSPKFLSRDVSAQRYAYMGVAHARRGNLPSALENWRLAARTLPTHTLVQNNLGAVTLVQIHDALKRNDKVAALSLAAAVDGASDGLKPALGGFNYEAALDLAHQKKWGEAAQKLKHVAQLLQEAKASERRPILYNQALLYEMNNDWSSAAAAWREVLRVLPRGRRASTPDGVSNDPRKWIRRRAIECYKSADQLGEAIKVLRQAIKQTPEDVDTQLDLVRVLYANEQEQAAESEAQRLLKKDPNHVETLLQLGEMQLEEGRLHAAEMNLLHALSIASDDRRVRIGMAEVLHQRAHEMQSYGDNKQAIKFFERAMDYAPDSSSILECASRAYITNNQDDKAHALLDHLLKTGKGDPDAYLEVARIWASEKNADEVEAVITRAEASGMLNARLLGMVGMQILDMVYPSPSIDILDAMIRKFGLPDNLLDSPVMSRPVHPTDPKLRDYGHALLSRAMQHPTASAAMLKSAFLPLLGICPREVLPYYEWIVERAPTDANFTLMLGCARAIQKQYKEAEAALDRARALAKASKDGPIEELAREFRRRMREPEFLPFITQMFDEASLLNELDIDLSDL